MVRECLVETTPGNALSLDNTGDYHDGNSGMKLANVLYNSIIVLPVLTTESTSIIVSCPCK